MEKYILFNLGGECFGLNINKVVEILKAHKANPIPETPEYIAGVMTLRGVVVPVVDMRKRLGLAPVPVKERIIVVKSRGRERIGLIVDEVLEIKGFSDGETSSPPAIFRGMKTEYLSGIGKRTGGVAILLDMERILSSEERIFLQAAPPERGQAGTNA